MFFLSIHWPCNRNRFIGGTDSIEKNLFFRPIFKGIYVLTNPIFPRWLIHPERMVPWSNAGWENVWDGDGKDSSEKVGWPPGGYLLLGLTTLIVSGHFFIRTSLFDRSLKSWLVREIIPKWPNYSGWWIFIIYPDCLPAVNGGTY